MTTTSPEFLTLEAIRDWMATLTIWQQWTGLSGDALEARVVWPIKNAPALPVAVRLVSLENQVCIFVPIPGKCCLMEWTSPA